MRTTLLSARTNLFRETACRSETCGKALKLRRQTQHDAQIYQSRDDDKGNDQAGKALKLRRQAQHDAQHDQSRDDDKGNNQVGKALLKVTLFLLQAVKAGGLSRIDIERKLRPHLFPGLFFIGRDIADLFIGLSPISIPVHGIIVESQHRHLHPERGRPPSRAARSAQKVRRGNTPCGFQHAVLVSGVIVSHVHNGRPAFRRAGSLLLRRFSFLPVEQPDGNQKRDKADAAQNENHNKIFHTGYPSQGRMDNSAWPNRSRTISLLESLNIHVTA